MPSQEPKRREEGGPTPFLLMCSSHLFWESSQTGRCQDAEQRKISDSPLHKLWLSLITSSINWLAKDGLPMWICFVHSSCHTTGTHLVCTFIIVLIPIVLIPLSSMDGLLTPPHPGLPFPFFSLPLKCSFLLLLSVPSIWPYFCFSARWKQSQRNLCFVSNTCLCTGQCCWLQFLTLCWLRPAPPFVHQAIQQLFPVMSLVVPSVIHPSRARANMLRPFPS